MFAFSFYVLFLLENYIDGATLAILPEDFVEFSHLVPQSGLRIRLKAAIEKLMCSDYQPSHEVYYFKFIFNVVFLLRFHRRSLHFPKGRHH